MASEIKVDTISEKTSANGVTIDGVSLKDSKIATANSVDSDAYVDASIDNAHLADNAVDTAEIADNAVTLAKMDGLARGTLIYGDASGDPAALAAGGADEVLTHDGTDLSWAAASGFDVSSITGATALGAEPADTDEFVLSDAGVLKRVDYSYIKAANTPAFAVNAAAAGTTVSYNTYTKVTWDTEVFDTDSAFASDKFTVPAGADGKYFISALNAIYSLDSDDLYLHIGIWKNGAVVATGRSESNDKKRVHATVNSILDLVETDYLEVYVAHTSGTETTNYGAGTFFGGFKLIGV